MDTSVSFFSLPFGDTETFDFCYDVIDELPQDTVDLQSTFAPSFLQDDDVLNEFLSRAEPQSQVVEAQPVSNEPTSNFCCETCGKCFDNPKKYYGHLRVHAKDTNWTCEQCPELKFSTKNRLLKHQMTHDPSLRAFPCSQCPMTFTLNWRLQQHIKAKHLKIRAYKCDVCNQSFAKPSDLNKHKSTYNKTKKYSCPTCDMKFNDKSNLQRHIASHSNLKPYVCVGCKRGFAQIATMKKHSKHCPLVIVKEDDMPGVQQCRKFYCNVCGKLFQYKSLLIKHKLSDHSQNSNIKSSETKEINKINDTLVDDILLTEDILFNPDSPIEKNYSTTNAQNMDTENTDILQVSFLNEINQLNTLDDELFYNDIDFDNLQPSLIFNMPGEDVNYTQEFDFPDKQLDQDIINALYQVKSDLPDELLDIEPVKMPDPISECATIFEKDVDLEASTHLAANLNQLIGENNVQYIATENDDTFIISLNSGIDAEQLTDMLNIEVVNDEKIKKKKVKKELTFVCKTCKKVFRRKENFWSHLATHEASLRRFSCGECGLRFSYQSTLRKHTRATHLPPVEAEHACSVCGNKYRAKWLLKNHMERDHSKLTPFVCDHRGCRKSFYKSHDLVIHKRYHSGERPFKCGVCNKAFPHPSHLSRHCRTVDCTKLKHRIKNMVEVTRRL